MQLRKTTLGAIAALAVVPATAFAATITGAPGNERLRGTNAADVIDGNGGNDRIWGAAATTAHRRPRQRPGLRRSRQRRDRRRRGNDVLVGGPGDDTVVGDATARGDRTSFDRIFGGSGNDKLCGGDSRDRDLRRSGQRRRPRATAATTCMAGGPGDDVQNGGAGNDVIFANRGQDTSIGGDGNDVLWAMARADVTPGPNGEATRWATRSTAAPATTCSAPATARSTASRAAPGDDGRYLDTVRRHHRRDGGEPERLVRAGDPRGG